EVLSAIGPELEIHLPGVTSAIDEQSLRVFRWKHGAPGSPVGHCRSIASYRQWVSENVTTNHVVLAGDAVGFYGTDGASASGRWAANAVLAGLKARHSSTRS